MNCAKRLLMFFFGSACAVAAASISAFPHSGVVHIYAGQDASCALLADHHVACWGSNMVANSLAPSDVPRIRHAVELSLGQHFACEIASDSYVYCWGDNSRATLGDAGFVSRPIDPEPVENTDDPKGLMLQPLLGVSAIASGATHTCIILDDSTTKCWGTNFSGEAGYAPTGGYAPFAFLRATVHDGIRPDRPLADVVALAGGDEHTCAQLSDSSVACWGWNHFGQLGNYHAGDYVSSPIPVLIPSSSGDQKLKILGDIRASETHTCAILSESAPLNNSIACWGDNRRGQLGNDVGDSSASPVAVDFPDGTKLTNVLQIATGGNFNCAVLVDATAACWGDNTYGQLGNNEFPSASSLSPVPVGVFGVKVTNVIELATGYDQACALVDNPTHNPRQEVICWGRNLSGQLGTGDQDSEIHSIPVVAPVDGPIFTDGIESD